LANREAALAAGAAAYLVKPVVPDVLTDAVVQALGGTAGPFVPTKG
jgi:DNA-binding NarL/FixJ family response regulator